MCFRQFVVLAGGLFGILVATGAFAVDPPAQVMSPESRVGQAVAPIEILDDAGTRRSLQSLGGQPLILLPMYTHCQKACLGNTKSLQGAVAGLDLPDDRYRVVLFSFDSKETPESLRAFRQKEGIPLAWTLATSDAASIQRLMDSIAFAYADANGQFLHPNRAVFLTSDLSIAGFIYGSRYTTEQVLRNLSIANHSGGFDFLGWAAKYLLGVVIFLVTAFAVYLTHLVSSWKSIRPTFV